MTTTTHTPTPPTMSNWRRIVGQRVSRLTEQEARDKLAAIRAEGVTMFHPTIRELTNGLNSQSINHYVIQRLAHRAALAKVTK